MRIRKGETKMKTKIVKNTISATRFPAYRITTTLKNGLVISSIESYTTMIAAARAIAVFETKIAQDMIERRI
jgi:hypothetical protein